MILAFLKALPLSAYLALGVAGFIGVREWQHAREQGRLETLLDGERWTVKNLRIAVAHEQANTQRIKAEIQRQNDALTALVAAKKQLETEAQLRAVRRLTAGEAVAADRRRETPTLPETPRVPPGHEGLNAWLNERVTP